jgi:hypothetical protein
MFEVYLILPDSPSIVAFTIHLSMHAHFILFHWNVHILLRVVAIIWD